MSEERVFSRNDIISLPTPKVEKHFVEKLNAYVHFKQMSAEELDSYDWSLVKIDIDEEGNEKFQRNMSSSKVKYLVRILCDEKGYRLFKDDEYAILGKKSPVVINALYEIARKVNDVGAIKNSKTEE
jgi:hypothetical protein